MRQIYLKSKGKDSVSSTETAKTTRQVYLVKNETPTVDKSRKLYADAKDTYMTYVNSLQSNAKQNPSLSGVGTILNVISNKNRDTTAYDNAASGLKRMGLTDEQVEKLGTATFRKYTAEQIWKGLHENNPELWTEDERKQYIQDYENQQAENQRLLNMDLNQQKQLIEQQKPSVKQDETNRRISVKEAAWGENYTPNTERTLDRGANTVQQTSNERRLSTLQSDYNKAKTAQYDRDARQLLADNPEYVRIVEERKAGAEGKDATAMKSYDYETSQILENAGYGYGTEAYKKLTEAYKWVKDQERYDETYEKAKELATYNPGIASVASVPTNIFGSAIGAVDLLAQGAENGTLFGGESDKPINTKSAYMRGYATTQGVRNTVAEGVQAANADGMTNGELASFLYQTGMSMADSAAIMAMGAAGVPTKIGTALLGTSAGVDATVQAKQNGASDQQALLTGIAAGVAEAVFEEVSLEKLKALQPAKAAGSTGQYIKTISTNILKQSFTEGMEEVTTSVANLITDYLINGGNSDFERRAAEVGQTQAAKEFAVQLLTDYAGGALSGGVFGAVPSIAQTGSDIKQYDKDTVRALQQERNTQKYMESGMTEEEAEAKAQSDTYKKAGALKAMNIKAENENYVVKQAAEKYNGDVKESFLKSKPADMDAADYINAFDYAYESGKAVDINRGNVNAPENVKSISEKTGLPYKITAKAYMAGLSEAKGVSNATEENTNRSGSTERSDGVDGRGQTGELAEERRFPDTEQGRRAAEVSNYGQLHEGEVQKVSASELGIQNGTTDKNLWVVPTSNLPAAMQTVVDDVMQKAKSRGNEIVIVAGDNGIQIRGGTTVSGVHSSHKFILRADNTSKSLMQLYDHEDYHEQCQRDKGLLERTKQHIVDQYGKEELDRIVNRYIAAYRMSAEYLVASETRKEAIVSEIVEEICADAYAGINITGSDVQENATKFTDIVVGDMVQSVAAGNVLAGNNTAQKHSRDTEYLFNSGREDIRYSRDIVQNFFDDRNSSNIYLLEGREYFDAEMELYSKYQDGIANKDNFFKDTVAEFSRVSRRPSRKPDYVSRGRYGDVSSEYWYRKDGVIRGSKHWGLHIRSCDWKLEGVPFMKESVTHTSKLYGFCRWEDFILKTYIYGSKKDSNGLYRDFSEAKLATFRNQYETGEIRQQSDVMKYHYSRDTDGVETVTNNGNLVAEMDENNAKFSIDTYENGGREALNKFLDKEIKNGHLKKEETDDIRKQMDYLYKICSDFDKANTYAPFSAWSHAEVQRDAAGIPIMTVVKANGEYSMNIDFSLVCKKRRTLDAVFNEMIKRGIMEELDGTIDKGQEAIVQINDIIRSRGFETACTLCFVDAKRFRQAKVADDFVDIYNHLVRSMGGDAGYFNFGENGLVSNTDATSGTDMSEIDKYLKEYGEKTVEYGVAKHLKNNPQDRKLLLRGDFMSTKGFENVKAQNAEIMKLFNRKKGSGGPKAALGDVQYMNEIIAPRKFNVQKAYSVGGVRVQSFSDYVPRMVFDYIQMIADLSAKNLPAHSYTKEAMYVLQFGQTGMKINMSLIPAVVKDGIAPGLDRYGNYVFADESFAGTEDDIRFAKSIGINTDGKSRGQIGYELAKMIQNAKDYSENVGTICVGVSSQHIWKLLEDDTIRMVIPYHKSGLNHIVATMNNIDSFTDYTVFQNTRYQNGTKISDEDAKGMPDFNQLMQKGLSPVEAAQKYLEWCDNKGFKPKFDEFRTSKNYYKLLTDFAVYDNGNVTKQGGVQMKFPGADGEFGAMSELIKIGLDNDAVLEGKRQEAIPEMVDAIEEVFRIGKKQMFSRDVDQSFSRDVEENLQAENEALRDKVEKLTERKDYFKAQGEKTTNKVHPLIVKHMAENYVKGNTLEASEITESLQELGNYMHGTQDKNAIYDNAKEMAMKIGRTIVEARSEIYNYEDVENLKNLRRELRNKPIKITDSITGDFADFKEWRADHKYIVMSKNATADIESRYAELRDKFGEAYFPSTITPPSEMLRQIAKAAEAMAPMYWNPDSMYIELAAETMANKIMDDMILPTKTDRLIANAKAGVVEKYEKQIASLIVKSEQREKMLQDKSKRRSLADEMYYNRKINEMRTNRNEYMDRQAERKKFYKYSDGIKKIAASFRGMLLHPTDTRYAPTELMDACYQVAMMLDTSSENRMSVSSAKLSEQMARIKAQYDDMQNSDNSDYSLEYDKDFSYMVGQLQKRIGGMAIRDMTAAEVEDVYYVLSDINEMLKNARYQISSTEKITNYTAGVQIMDEQEKRRVRTSGEQKMDAIMRQTGSVLRNVNRMTDFNEDSRLYKLFADLNDGIKKKNKFIMDANKLFDEYAGARMRKAATELNEYSIAGEKVKMTEMQAMQMILTWEREATNNITNHMQGGGIVIPNHEQMLKGNYKEAIRIGQRIESVSQSDILALQDTMDEWNNSYMAAARSFFNGMAQDAVNDATMKLKHRKVATTRNYIPFEIDDGTVAREIEGVKFDATIEGMGMLKSVQEGAYNALVMRGLNDIITRHIDKTSNLYGLAVPIKNYNKAMGVKKIGSRRVVRDYLNSSDSKLLDQAITDLQTSRTRDNGDITKIANKLQSAFVKSTLMSNISVTIKQAASYSTAGLYLSQKALAPYQTTIAKLFANNESEYAKNLFAEIDAHTPEHYIRRMGMSTTEAAIIAKDNGLLVNWMDEKIKNDALNPLKWIQNMDVATTAAIWLACKEQVRLDGITEADTNYWSNVTKLYEKVIEETQPMYDVLHRPEVQKTTNELVKSIIMFQTQPLQNAGIIWDSFGRYFNAKKQGKGIAEAKQNLANAVGSQIASAAVFSVMTFLAYASKNRLKRYKNDEEEVTALSIIETVLKDMGKSVAGVAVPVAGSYAATFVDDLINKIVNGGTTYDLVSVPIADTINEWANDLTSLTTDAADGKWDEIGGDIGTIALDVSAMFGIPVENALNIIKGIVGNITDATGNPIPWATDESNTVKGTIAAFNNGHFETGKEKMKRIIEDKMKSGKTEKEAKSSLKSSFTTKYKPMYIKAKRNNNKAEMERIRKILDATGLYENLSETLSNWAKS